MKWNFAFYGSKWYLAVPIFIIINNKFQIYPKILWNFARLKILKALLDKPKNTGWFAI